VSEEINEDDVLDEMIRDLQDRLRERTLEFEDRMRINDRLLKAIALRRKKRGRGRGFNLGQD
jgi:hypothetical protein